MHIGPYYHMEAWPKTIPVAWDNPCNRHNKTNMITTMTRAMVMMLLLMNDDVTMMMMVMMTTMGMMTMVTATTTNPLHITGILGKH